MTTSKISNFLNPVKKSPNDLWEVAWYSDQGKRGTLEDVTLYEDAFAGDTAIASLLVGVFDGHSGARCARYLSEQLPAEIKRHPKFGEDAKSALRDAFMNMDQKWLETHAKRDMFEDGSTALCLCIQNDELFVANTGDCRAIMCVGGQTVVLSRDHKAEDKEEEERIVRLGGSVVGGRVQGTLEVSRSFGDYKFKENDQKYLTAEPEITKYIFTPDVDFIVMGCDGLYEEWLNEDIVNYVKKGLDQKEGIQEIIEGLVHEAIDRGCLDNVTAIIIKFEKTYKKLIQNGKFPSRKTTKGKAEKNEKRKSKTSISLEPIKKKPSPSSQPTNKSKALAKSSIVKNDMIEKGEEKRARSYPNDLCKANNSSEKIKKVLPESLGGHMGKTSMETLNANILVGEGGVEVIETTEVDS